MAAAAGRGARRRSGAARSAAPRPSGSPARNARRGPSRRRCRRRIVPDDEAVGSEVDGLHRRVGVQRRGKPHGQREAVAGSPGPPEGQRLGVAQGPGHRVVVGERVAKEIQRIERLPPAPLAPPAECPAVLGGRGFAERDAAGVEQSVLAGARIVEEPRPRDLRLELDPRRQPERPPVPFEPGEQARQGARPEGEALDPRPPLAAVAGDRPLDQLPGVGGVDHLRVGTYHPGDLRRLSVKSLSNSPDSSPPRAGS
jgi:hypothetical protein